MKSATKYIHAGSHPDPSTGAIMTPVYMTSTYVQEAPGVNKGYEYARSQNPTRTALEEALAVIENGKYGLAFSSGVAATDAVIKLLNPGDEVICANDMYGGTYRLFTKVFERFGIVFRYVDTTVCGQCGSGHYRQYQTGMAGNTHQSTDEYHGYRSRGSDYQSQKTDPRC